MSGAAENAGYFAPLGFEIDTASLGQGKAASDAFTQSLDRMANAADRASTSTGKPGSTIRRSADEARNATDRFRTLSDALRVTGTSADSVTGPFNNVQRLIDGLANGSLGGLNSGLSTSLGLLGRLPSALAPVSMGLAVATGGAVSLGGAYLAVVSATSKVVDRYAVLDARLKNVYGSQEAAKAQMAEIITLAEKNGVAIRETADAYLRMARNNEAIGLTRREMVDLTDEVQMLGHVSGATTMEMTSGMIQFGQALASGRLGGDELRTIMESMPALAKAIADGMGVTVGQLRAMGAAGELTGDKISKALLKQLPEIQKEFSSLPQTTDQAFTRVGNAWELLLKRMGENLDSSSIMQRFARGAEDTINWLSDGMAPTTTEDLRRKALLEFNMSSAAEKNLSISFGRKADPTALNAFNKGLGYEAMSQSYDQGWDARNVERSFGIRALTVIGQIDQKAQKAGELKSQLTTLEDEFKRLQSNAHFFSPEELERLQKIPAYIAAIKRQLEDTLPALTKYRLDSSRQIADFVRYGGGGGAEYGSDVRKLMEQAASAGSQISRTDAEVAVSDRRVQSIKEQTEVLKQQIEQERLLASVAGQDGGSRMRMQAQVDAQKFQIDKFGTKPLSGEEARSVAEYEKALLGLSAAKAAVADAEAAAKAGQEAEIQRQLDAAQAAGANAGALRKLEVVLRKLQAMSLAATPEAASAIAATAVNEQMARARAERQKIDALLQTVEDRRTALNAASPADARQAGYASQARSFSAEFSPDQQGAAYAAKMLELHTQDAEAIKRILDDKQRGVELQAQELAAVRLGGIAGQIALAKAKEMNDIKASGLKLTQEEIAARLKLAETYVLQEQRLQQARQQAAAYENIWTSAASSIGGAVDDAFQKVLDGQEVKVGDIVKRIVSHVGAAIIQATITQPLTSIFTQFASGLRVGGGAGSMAAAAPAAGLSSLFGAGRVAMTAANSNAGGFTSVISGQGMPAITTSPVVPVAPQLATQRLTGYANNGSFSGVGAYAARGAENVDPRLTDILQTTAERSGWKVQAFSGYRPGDPRFHGRGMATDIRLIDPATGRGLDSPGHTGHYQSAQYYREYENFAQQARLVQMEKYPELNKQFRWGGYFSSKRGMHGYGALDGMHYDLGGGRLGMAAGSWEGGLNAMGRRAYPGIQSAGMSQKVVDQITSQWKTQMTAANANIAQNMPKTFETPMKSVASSLAKSIDVGPLQKLSPAISNVTQASSTAVPALGGFGNSIMSLLQQIIPGIGSSLIGSIFGSAHGSVYEGGVRMYGNGGVVTRPFAFKTRGGMGVMGEAGPEAIMPLRRGPDGKLGVAAAGGGGGGDVSVVVNDMRSNAGSHPVETESKKGPNGQRMIAVTIRDQVRSQMKGGKFDAAMNQSYGVGRKLTGR